MTLKAAKVNLLPTLNLILSGGFEGIGSDFSPAVNDQFKQPFWNYGIGFDLEVPIGNREARAIYQRTLLQRQEAVDQYRNIIEKVTDEVKDAQREVMVTWEEVVRQPAIAAFAAAEQLRLLEQREPAVTLTPEFVLTKLSLQSDLADAQRKGSRGGSATTTSRFRPWNGPKGRSCVTTTSGWPKPPSNSHCDFREFAKPRSCKGNANRKLQITNV